MSTITATRPVVDVALPEDEPPASGTNVQSAPTLEKIENPWVNTWFASSRIEHFTVKLADGQSIDVALLGNAAISITTEPSRSTYKYPVATFEGRAGYIEHSYYGDKKHAGGIVAYNADLKTVAVFWSANSTTPLATFRVV